MLGRRARGARSFHVADDSEETNPRRPIYLVVALVALWLVGMNSAAEGFAVIEIVKNPFSGAFGTLAGQAVEGVLKRAFVDGITSMSRVALPLGIGQLILGAALVGVCAKALFGRRASPGFALQVILANAAILVVSYSLRQPVRERIVNSVVASGVEERPSNVSPTEFDRLVSAKWWWSFRVGLGLQLVALGFGAIAITRRSARAVLARAEPSTSEER